MRRLRFPERARGDMLGMWRQGSSKAAREVFSSGDPTAPAPADRVPASARADAAKPSERLST